MKEPLMIFSFPRAILHIDGDAFFASCEQSRNPKLQGKPVITGKERGIVASMSYEAKARGVKRGMRLFEVKKICPDAIFLPSDYETYSLLSKRMFSIVRRYTPEVEEYSIDECFADITGLRRPLKMNYYQIAEAIKRDLDRELGFTFSIGLAPNKVVAKLGSKWKKPSGLTAIPGRSLHTYLERVPVEKIWGIGPNTASYLEKNGMHTALGFARKDERWIKDNLTKPHKEIWAELNGKHVMKLVTEEKHTYTSIQKVKTFTPASGNSKFVFAQLSKNIENACIKARRYNLAAKEVFFFLKTQDFRYRGIELKFSRPTAIPEEIITKLQEQFFHLFKEGYLYRSTGVALLKLTESKAMQLDLFDEALHTIQMKKLYEVVDSINNKYGKHKIYLGSSFQANKFSQHLGERGDIPQRKRELFKGETARKRLNIPMLMSEIN
jgi:DNA polymerase IV